jgi:hypothetical protein
MTEVSKQRGSSTFREKLFKKIVDKAKHPGRFELPRMLYVHKTVA